MEKRSKRSLFGANPFTEAFAEFDETTFFEQLHNTVKNKSYFEKYKGFKRTLLLLSYLFNLMSALTASYAVYWLVNRLTGIFWVGYIVALVFLFFLEKIKRKSSSEFWQVWFFRKHLALGWMGLSLFCLSLSLFSSGFGIKQGTEQLSPTPELLKTDSLASFYQTEIARLEGVNHELRANKNKDGTTFYKLYDAINANTKSISQYRSRAQELEKQLQGKNHQLTMDYKQETQLTAWSLVWITLCMELLFELCLCYIWYYYYRSYVERNDIQKTYNVDTNKLQTGSFKHTDSPTLTELESIVSKLQSENESLRSPHHPISKPSESGSQPQDRTPIGFHKDVAVIRPSQVCTGLHREINNIHTVAHTYTKGEKRITVHYTMANINARIAQYERDLAAAIEKNMEEEVIQNRTGWLQYWRTKKQELTRKQEGSVLL